MIIDIHAHLGHHPIMDFKQEVKEILDVMNRFGIDKTFVLPFPSMKMKKVNDAVADAVKKHPDRLVGFACIDPASEDAFAEIDRVVDIGLKGVMLDPDFHRVFGRRGPSTIEEIMFPCMDHELPVLLNTPNDEVGEAWRMGREPYYEGLNGLASKFPSVRFFIGPYWPRITELMKAYPNVFVDSGGRNGIGAAVRIAQDLAPTRVCFGSESPQNHPALGIKAIRTLKMTPVYREMILGKNAERIFKDIL